MNTKPSGSLYIVATPIGNMEDITIRAINTLKQVGVIAAEDTRKTARLLSHHQIRSPLISCHEHNEHERIDMLIKRMSNGEDVALVSDAGTPTLSDPGYRLIHAAVAAGITVVPIPGPSAAVSALSASGLPTDTFVFVGFLPKKKGKRQTCLQELKAQPRTLVFYESPRRIIALLEELRAALGDRRAVVCREMTKIYEEFIRGTLSELQAILASRQDVKGECTVLVAGESEGGPSSLDDAREEIAEMLAAEGITISSLSKLLAKKYGVSKNVIYQEALNLKKRRQD